MINSPPLLPRAKLRAPLPPIRTLALARFRNKAPRSGFAARCLAALIIIHDFGENKYTALVVRTVYLL